MGAPLLCTAGGISCKHSGICRQILFNGGCPYFVYSTPISAVWPAQKILA